MWPFICQFIEKLFRETIEPAVRGAHTHLSTFSFTRVDVGQQVCFFLSVLTCAQLKRMVNYLRLSLEKAVLRKVGSVCGSFPRSASHGALSSSVGASLRSSTVVSWPVQVRRRSPQPQRVSAPRSSVRISFVQLSTICPAGKGV